MSEQPDGDKRTDFLTARQLAEHLQVSETTVNRLRRRGLIPSVRLTSRIVRYNLKDVRSALVRASARSQRAAEQEEVDLVASNQMDFDELFARLEAEK